jgi:hypothetical protein
MTIEIGFLEKRLSQLKKEVPTRGFERHPSALKKISDLPVELLSPAIATLASSETIQTIISFPPQLHRGWNYVPKQALLFTSSGMIHLMASIWPDQDPQVTSVSGSGLIYLKVKLLLLYGFLEIVAQGIALPTRLGMEFNTVAWEWLSTPIRQFLQTTIVTPGALTDRILFSPTAQQALEKLPLKFSNGMKIFGILPGEELEDLVFQPGTSSAWIRWLHLFRRPITANTLLSITSNYMVVIQEELEVAQGWIISYIPGNSIIGMQNRPRGLWNELTVRLKKGDQTSEYKLLLTSEAIDAWRMRWLQHNCQWQDLPDEVEN